jgi:hypothetical protein
MNLFEMTAQQRKMLEEIEKGELSEESARDTLVTSTETWSINCPR